MTAQAQYDPSNAEDRAILRRILDGRLFSLQNDISTLSSGNRAKRNRGAIAALTRAADVIKDELAQLNDY